MAEQNPIVDPTLVSATTDAVMTALIKTGVIKVPRAARKRVNWERLLMYEYVKMYYAEVPHWFREEVGPIPGGNNDPLYSRLRRWADCIIRMPDHMLLIEGKMKAKVEVVSQLHTYANLLPQTPLFTKYKDLPIKMLLVCAMIDDETKMFVERAGIEVIIFKPSNFEDWFKYIIQKGETE